MTPVRWVWLGWVLLGLLIEGYAVWTRTQGDTLSETIWDLTRRYPLVAFTLGFLMGHFFWQRALPNGH